MCVAPLFLAVLLFTGCSVTEMSSLRELSRPYAGEYACETLTVAGREMLDGFEYVRLTLGYGNDAVLRWKKKSGGAGEKTFAYDAAIEEGRITFSSGRMKRTFPIEDGKICIELIVCGVLLYARFAL